MKWFYTTRGGSRFILIIGNFVLKIPYYRTVGEGIKQNKYEWQNRNRSKYLTKLYVSLPFGLCNIAERVTPLNKYDYSKLDLKEYFKVKVKSEEELRFLLVDSFSRNFGRRKNGDVVKLDWGYENESS